MVHNNKSTESAFGAAGTLAERFPRDAQLIADLMSSDLQRRLGAQHMLVSLGGKAVPALLEALVHDDRHVRNAAAHVLAVIAEPVTATALAAALDDEEAPVRWVAAEGLVALGSDGLKAALHALVSAEIISPQMKAAVRHILLSLRDDDGLGAIARPVLTAMHKFEVHERVLVEADKALTALDNLAQSR